MIGYRHALPREWNRCWCGRMWGWWSGGIRTTVFSARSSPPALSATKRAILAGQSIAISLPRLGNSGKQWCYEPEEETCMPARIVIVHDDNQFLEAATTTLRDAGYDVAAFADTLSALDALNHANKVEVLITRVEYPEGQPHGLALARIGASRPPDINGRFPA